MAEERSLPGWPRKKLVKEVRRHLWHYGIRPTQIHDLAGDLELGRRHRQILLARPLADAQRNRHAVHSAPAGRDEE